MKKANYSTSCLDKLEAAAKPAADELTEKQRSIRSELEEQRRTESLEKNLLGKGGVLEQQEHRDKYHAAYIRVRELEREQSEAGRECPRIDPSLLEAAAEEARQNCAQALERAEKISAELEAVLMEATALQSKYVAVAGKAQDPRFKDLMRAYLQRLAACGGIGERGGHLECSRTATISRYLMATKAEKYAR